MDSSDEKTLMESLDPVIVELLKENVRLRGEIDRLKERLDNKARLMIFQEGYASHGDSPLGIPIRGYMPQMDLSPM